MRSEKPPPRTNRTDRTALTKKRVWLAKRSAVPSERSWRREDHLAARLIFPTTAATSGGCTTGRTGGGPSAPYARSLAQSASLTATRASSSTYANTSSRGSAPTVRGRQTRSMTYAQCSIFACSVSTQAQTGTDARGARGIERLGISLPDSTGTAGGGPGSPAIARVRPLASRHSSE